MKLLPKALAFVRKDFLEETSYRMRLLLNVAGMCITLVFLFLFSEFIGDAISDKLGEVDYLAFALVGIGYHALMDTAIRDLAGKIRQAQTLGTLEALLATRTSIFELMLCMPLYPFLRTTLRLLVFLGLGYLFLDVPIHWGNWPAAVLLFGLSILVFGSLGLAFAGLTVVFKRTEPVIHAFGTLSFLLGGVFFPVSALHSYPWLQQAAYFVPMTPALIGFRKAILENGDWQSIQDPVLSLLLFILVLAPLSLLVFRWGMRKAMRDGSLTQY